MLPDAHSIHDNAALFAELLQRAEARLDLESCLVEKDYWVTYTLDVLQRIGFEVHFKGGTSLSKGYGLIERFSEDLDLKLDAAFLHVVDNKMWKRSDDKGFAARRTFFDDILKRELPAPLQWSELDSFNDKYLRNIGIRVDYPQTVPLTNTVMRSYLLLEVGRARVTPYVDRTISSWVHDELELAGETVQRPVVRCVHPLVTLFEKSSALQGRAARDDVDPGRYVRHYEDAVHIVRAWTAGKLPPVDGFANPKDLAAELVKTKDIEPLDPQHDAFNLASSPERAARQRQAWTKLGPYYWGERVSLDDATTELREWLSKNL